MATARILDSHLRLKSARVPKINLPVQAQYQSLYAAPAQFPIPPQTEASEQAPPGVEPEPSSEPTLLRQVVPLAQPVAEPEELHAPEINAQDIAAAGGIAGTLSCIYCDHPRCRDCLANS